MRSARVLIHLSILLLLVACAPGAAAGQTRLVMAVPHGGLFDSGLPLALGREKGFFREAGLDVEWVVVRGGGESVQAVLSGSAQVGMTGFFAVLSAFQKGAPVRILAAEMKGTAELFWYAAGDSPYRKMEDLAGKRIAFSTQGSASHMAVLAVVDQLKARGFPAPQAIPLGSPPSVFTAVKTGQADAGWAVPPLFLDKMEKGEIRVVFRGEEIERLREVTIRVLFADADFAEKNADVFRAFFRAYRKALDFMFDNREETVRIWISHAKIQLPEATVMKVYDFYPRGSLAFRPVSGARTAVENAVRFGFLKQPLTQAELERLIDLRYVP